MRVVRIAPVDVMITLELSLTESRSLLDALDSTILEFKNSDAKSIEANRVIKEFDKLLEETVRVAEGSS